MSKAFRSLQALEDSAATPGSSSRLGKLSHLSAHELGMRQPELLVLDARSWLEYVLGHIPGARHLSHLRILREVAKDQPVAVACLSGHRSLMLANWLIRQGYQKVYNLQGGLMSWQRAGYPTKFGFNS